MHWIQAEAEQLQNELVSHRRWLHAHAETGFQLNETKSYVKQALMEMGIAVQDCGKCGLTAVLGDLNSGKTILLRADMDALPIAEESGVEFSCTNGNMHACGHDMHTSMLLGAAKILKQNEERLPGCVKLMFQPAEEIFEGSADMIAAGILKDPVPDAAVMIHVTAATPIPAGAVIVCPSGVGAPAADYFTITVQGKGCHGSTPHNGIDALTSAAHILLALQEIHARELPASEEAVLTIGKMHGGSAANAIADQAVLEGTIRTYSEKTRAYLKDRIEKISTCVAEAYRSKCQVAYGSGCPTLINNKELGIRLYAALKDSVGGMVMRADDFGGSMRGGGSEDFAYISQQIPSIMLALAAGEPDKGYPYPQHHPMVKFDETVLSRGAAIFAACAVGFLSDQIS